MKRRRKEQRTAETQRKQVTKGKQVISINTLNNNGLSVPIKRHRWLIGTKTKISLYAAYKRIISELKTCTD